MTYITTTDGSKHKYLSRQEAFTKAYNGLARQGFVRSMNVENECAYRGENGVRCAYGHLIPDESYDPSFEGLAISSLNSYKMYDLTEKGKKLFEAGNIDPDDFLFYTKLQNCHDNNETPDGIKNALIAFAKEFYLTVPVIEDI